MWFRSAVVASFPGFASQTIRKVGGEPGTSWHVNDIILRQVETRRHIGITIVKRSTAARLTTCTTRQILWKQRQTYLPSNAISRLGLVFTSAYMFWSNGSAVSTRNRLFRAFLQHPGTYKQASFVSAAVSTVFA